MLVEAKTKTVYLIGGFMINDNYGDVIQAKVWVDFYLAQGIRVVFIYQQGGKKLIQQNFPSVVLLNLNSFIKRVKKGRLSKRAFVHMYGGGYLNNVFGDDFLKFFAAYKHNSSLMLITGVQVDETFAAKYFKIFSWQKRNIVWLSFRDTHSRRLINKRSSLICDDSFGYFQNQQKVRAQYNFLRIARSKILVQFSLNDYMYRKTPQNAKTWIQIRGFFFELEKLKDKVTFATSFGHVVPSVVEAEKIVNLYQVKTEFENKSIKEIADERWYADGYHLALVNSFHTYLFCRFKLGCPTYLISMSDFYDQKVDSLKEYGLIDEQHIIRDFKQLVKIDLKQKEFAYPEKEFKIMFDRFDLLKKSVLDQLAKF